MLSRFSQLPRFSFLNNQTYSTEHIEEIVTLVKKLGKSNNNNDNDTNTNEDVLKNITKILQFMKKYSNIIQIQRVCCHALSNLAMQVVVARWIMEKGGFKLLKNALNRFENDHKLCWLGSSAIWNLARPPANRALIGKSGVNLMLKILKKHNTKEKVTNTTIGALSNLSLCDELKDIIATDKNIDIILSVLNGYSSKNIQTVLTSGAGLLANLAVSDEHANTLVNRNSLPILLKVISWSKDKLNSNGQQRQQDETLFRNSCAALNNMVTAENFIESFLKSKGVEIVYSFLKTHNSELYTGLLENCLVHLECDINKETTSFHLCSLHNKLDILKQLVLENVEWNLNNKDSKNMTCLEYAISGNHYGVIQFLCKLGVNAQTIKVGDIVGGDGQKIINAMNKGIKVKSNVVMSNQNAVDQSLDKIMPKDINCLIASYHGVVDMLVAVDKY